MADQHEKTNGEDKMRFSILALIVGFELLLLVPPSHGASKLTIGYATVTARLMPPWIAHEQGILAKYGIEAQPILIRGAPTLVAGTSAGPVAARCSPQPPPDTILSFSPASQAVTRTIW